jgi:ribose transport system substrate-binding protein
MSDVSAMSTRPIIGCRALLTFATLSALAALGCGGSREAGADSARAASGASASGAKTFTIAMIAKSSTNPVFLSGRTGAEAAAKELSQQHGVDVRIDWLTPPTEDAAVQAQRIAQAANSGADAILLSASEAGKLVGAINDAVDRGVPVMTFDSDVPTVTCRSPSASRSTAGTTKRWAAR